MIPVYLCEDEKEQLIQLTKIIHDIIMMSSLDMQIMGSFLKPDELLAAIHSVKTCSALYFLDIDLKCDMDGITLAGKIREQDPRAFVVFLTTHEEMAFRTLQEKVEPLGYLIKGAPDFNSQIEACLQNADKKYSSPQNPITDVLTLSFPDGIAVIKKQEIFFVESVLEPHKITIHEESHQISFRSSLKKFSVQLDERFLKCHGSYIINITHVTGIDKKRMTVHFSNGETCPCSARMYPTLLQVLKTRSE